MISLHHFIVDINFKKNFDLKTNPIILLDFLQDIEYLPSIFD